MGDAKQKLRIQFFAAGLPFNGDTLKTKALGGSETAAYYLARELARHGHDVTVWTTEKQEGMFEGVRYSWIGEPHEGAPLGDHFEQYARNTPHDVLIMQRSAGAFIRPYASKVNIWQLHDLALHRYTTPMMGGMWQVDAVTVVSDFHKQQIIDDWNINPDTVHVVRNGVDRSLYSNGVMPSDSLDELFKQIAAWQDEGNAVALYQSRPERGLEHLLRPGGIMDRCRDLPLKLLIGGYSNTVPQMAAFYGQLEDWAKALPNVMYIPPLSKQDLAILQQVCTIMLYPTEFGEVSCITAMEAQNAGLPMLTSDTAALTETCANSGTILIPLKDGVADEDAFVAQLEAWFDGDGDPLADLRGQQRARAPITDWSLSGEKLNDLCHELLAQKLSVPRVLRSAIERSDIDFAKWVLDNKIEFNPNIGVIEGSVADEIDRLYAFTENDHKYATHYRKHCGIYYDGHEEQVIGENVTHTTRYRGVLHFVAESVSASKEKKIRFLDWGCAHGHYVIPLAKTFRDSTFVGVDISERAIKAARKWKALEKLDNVEFYTLDEFRGRPEYDVILAAEVLEHVRDQDEFLEKLRWHLAPSETDITGGSIIFTTPNGRWEWLGTEPFRSAREHLRHYEREDIVDLCAGNKHEILHAPAGVDKGSFPIGSWVWCVFPVGPFGQIDYERKYAKYAPRETVSACLIVKDGENTLRRCVESFVDYVDEIRIFIDPKTTDRTMKVAEDLQRDFPNRPFVIRSAKCSATTDGFDEARNESIEGAAGDWILWCDADEEIRRPHLVHMFLRPSMHNGYGFPQVHYSTDPDSVLTTDFPCRLFRNNRGAKFYGVVHEHPETELGKAITWSLVRHELKFLHAGYVDDDTRRKRYERNLPLVLRDRKKHPTRELNKFLMIRDIAQGLMYEHRQTGGILLDHQKEQAEECIKLMEELVDTSQFIRMIVDAMQYYSHAVLTLGRGFDGDFTCVVKNDVAPDLSASLNVKGRFHSRAFFEKVVSRLSQESTKLYEDRYL